MGIDGFNPFIRDTIGEVSRQGMISNFIGKRIAIDGHNWMFKQIYGAQKRSLATTDIAMFGVDRSEVLGNWLEMITDFLINIIEIGSTPVVIFDGEHPPEKKKTKDKRRKKQRETVDRITELEKEISRYDPTSIPQEKVEELKKLVSGNTYVSYEEQEFLRNIMVSIGIPTIQAMGDAEQLCSMMCIEGLVDAVYSSDTDNYVYGCPVLITKLGKKVWSSTLNKYDREITYTCLSDILDKLKLSFKTFIDLCIMGGTDFNDNIPKYALKKSYNLLVKYGSIENLPSNLNTEILNYKRSREIFKVIPAKECWVSGIIDFPEQISENARDVLDSIGKTHMLPKLVGVISKCPKAKDRGWDIPPEKRQKLVINNEGKRVILRIKT